MALTPDFAARIVHSDASITDAVAFHAELRDIEASDEGVLYPAIHSYRQVALGGHRLGGFDAQLPRAADLVIGERCALQGVIQSRVLPSSLSKQARRETQPSIRRGRSPSQPADAEFRPSASAYRRSARF